MKNSKYLLILFTLIFLFVAACSNSDDSNKNEYWTCTMHPQVHKDGPGACPICGMDLIKKIIDDTTNVSDKSDMEGMLTLTTDTQVLANVSTVKIKNERLEKELSAYSYMDFVEQNRKTIPAKFNGRIEKLFVDKTGDYIKKGQPLFE
ncbi:MAG: efflux RND transporter periplasmic adaptor subunit, partial [Bacteroidales bacterium]|nr:efflux RND transporter periplasmic adaptor subunit [Bacteroidales bacterium]